MFISSITQANKAMLEYWTYTIDSGSDICHNLTPRATLNTITDTMSTLTVVTSS